MPLGGFDLDVATNGDLRSADIAGDVFQSRPGQPVGICRGQYPGRCQDFRRFVDDLGVPDIAKNALKNLSNFSYFGFQIEFPIFDDPASAIFNMLLGRDSDLFYFQADADVKLQGSQASPFSVFAMPIRYVGEADVKTHFKFAYDTYGFRHMLNGLANGGNSNPIEDLLNGFYIKSDSYFSVAGQIKAEAGQSIGLFGFSVDGGLSTGNAGTEPVSVVIVDPNQMESSGSASSLRTVPSSRPVRWKGVWASKFGSVGKSSASSSEFGNVTRSVKPS